MSADQDQPKTLPIQSETTEAPDNTDVPAWRPPSMAKPRGSSPHVEKELIDVRAKIYARSVTGIFARWRVILVWVTQAIFYGLPWINWNGRQAVLAGRVSEVA